MLNFKLKIGLLKHKFLESLLKIYNKWHYGSTIPLRTYKVHVPKSARITGKVNIIRVKNTSIELGNNITLRSDSFDYFGGMPFNTTLLVDREGGRISIGDDCRINGAYIHAKKSIIIGKNCVIAAGTNIFDSNGHQLLSANRTIGEDVPKEVVIGDNVWLCINSVVLKGTTIGDNCVVAANSVVKGDFPNNSLIQGNPAIVVSSLPIKDI